MPGINDSPRAGRARCSSRATEAGATSIGGIALHLRGEVRRRVHGLAARAAARISSPRYEQLYRRGAYAPRAGTRAAVEAGPTRAGMPSGVLAHARRPRRRDDRHGAHAAGALRPSRARPCRAAGAVLQPAPAQRLSRWPAAICAARCSSAPIRRATRPAELRREAREDGARRAAAAARRRSRRGFARSPLTTASATSSGVRVPTPGGSLTSASANMPASRMKPGKTVDDADAAPAQVGAQRRRRSRAGRTWSRCTAPCPASPPCRPARR